jgi:leucyl-tRNA synthetase
MPGNLTFAFAHPSRSPRLFPLFFLPACLRQVTEETEEMRFNTGLAAMMEFVNGAYKWEARPRAALEPFILLLAPYAPHLGACGFHPSCCTYHSAGDAG